MTLARFLAHFVSLFGSTGVLRARCSPEWFGRSWFVEGLFGMEHASALNALSPSIWTDLSNRSQTGTLRFIANRGVMPRKLSKIDQVVERMGLVWVKDDPNLAPVNLLSNIVAWSGSDRSLACRFRGITSPTQFGSSHRASSERGACCCCAAQVDGRSVEVAGRRHHCRMERQ